MAPAQDKIIRFLLRRHQNETSEDRALESFLDRLLIRIFTSTSLIFYLYDARVVDEQLELIFNELPTEIVPKVVELIGVPEVEPYNFRSEDTYHILTGFRFTPPEEFLEVL